MLQNPRLFLERLNNCFDDTGAPASVRERAVILSKLIDIPRPTAFSMLEGHLLPDDKILQQIADEFEVDATWLAGNK